MKNIEYNENILKDLLKENEKTLLYFYPKDNTPGCTVEATDFSKYKDIFNKNDINVIGVSKDSCASHQKFIDKQNLSIDLISDEEMELHNKFEVIGEKNMYGKIYKWIIRSTFLLDQEGNILKEWRNVKAKWHVEKLIRELEINK